jgi:hypothetical protein
MSGGSDGGSVGGGSIDGSSTSAGSVGGSSVSGDTSNNSASFFYMKITNGKGETLGNLVVTKDVTAPKLSNGSAVRTGNLTAKVTFTASADGSFYYSAVAVGAAEPNILTFGSGQSCVQGANTVTLYLMSGEKDLYIKVKDASGNVSDTLKIAVPAYQATSEQLSETDNSPSSESESDSKSEPSSETKSELHPKQEPESKSESVSDSESKPKQEPESNLTPPSPSGGIVWQNPEWSAITIKIGIQ